jgi:hypothetical protein
VEPPPELLELVWPELDGYIEVRDAEQLDPAKPVQEHQLCLAGAGFVNLLQQVRRYLLQDSAILQPIFPDHPIWAHEVFCHPLYAPFAERVRFQHTNSPESTPEQRLAAAIPTVAAQLQILRQEHSYQLASLQRSIDKTQEQNQLILRNQRRGYQLIPLSEHGTEGSLRADGTGMGRIAIVGGGGSAQADESNPTVAVDGQAPYLAPSGETHPTPDPSHRMSRQTTTVAQLYTEWFTGLGNKPSVVWMDRQFGTKWRSENKEKVFYSVRKTIIDHVEDRLRGGESLDTVLKHLQGTMVARSKGLQALSAAIRNWQHPGARKKKDDDWYEGPETASAFD